MKIAVLSGKGGTGKTFVSVNITAVAKSATYIDCDVEEPNGHLFFKPQNIVEKNVTVPIPVVANELCRGCRKCVDFCKFNALAFSREVIVFEDICHSCGGCMNICPTGAIYEKKKEIGRIQMGNTENISVISGLLNIGELSGVPIIKKALKITDNADFIFIDCPPGSSCLVTESIKDVDYCILVTEPTVFGLHNMDMVRRLVTLKNKPFGIVVNKAIKENRIIEEYCIKHNLKILCQIPYDDQIGHINSEGRILVNESTEYHKLFYNLLHRIVEEAHETVINP